MRYKRHDRRYKKQKLNTLNAQQICQTNTWAKTDHYEKNRLQRN